MPLPSQNPIFSCLVWIQTGSNFLVPAYPGCSGKEAIKWYSSSSICKGPTTVWPLVTVNAAPCCRSFNRLPVIEVLSCHIDSIASCLRSAHCDCVIVLRLLSLLHLPSNTDISCLTRLSHHVVFCFFTTMRRRGKSSFLVFSLNAYVYRGVTCLMALCPGLPGWASARKIKPICILVKQETVSSSGIKSAPHSRETTMPAPHPQFFTGQMPFLSSSQRRQSTEDTGLCLQSM